MKQALIITAPFGFGPASKALRLAETLSPSASVTIVSAGDAHRFVAEHAPARTQCRNGLLTELYEARDMAHIDLIVCVDHVPAARELQRSGYGSRLVFVDDLLQWRAGRDELQNETPILAYLVQDFPGAARHLSACRARKVELVAPMVWGDPRTQMPPSERDGLTLCFGGGTSPLVSWSQIRPQIASLLGAVWQVCRRLGLPLSVIGNPRLSEFASDPAAGLNILGSVSPLRSSQLISRSRLLITTPGIGAACEAFKAGTPVLLLPPTNSTQLQQFQVFRQHGMAHVLEGSPWLDELLQIDALPWTQHAKGCIEWSDRTLGAVADSVQGQAAALCDPARPGAAARRQSLLQRQDELVRGLSPVDIQQPLLQLLNGALR